MKIQQLIKKVNNTELGKMRTNDTYIHISKELDLGGFFDSPGASLDFRDRSSGQIFPLRYTEEREQRIVGLGEYYRCHDINAGDEILLERRDSNGITEYSICAKKFPDKIVFYKSSKVFNVLNQDRLEKFLDEGKCSLDVKYGNSMGKLNIEFSHKEEKCKKNSKKRVILYFYNLTYEDKEICDNASPQNLSDKIGLSYIELIDCDGVSVLQEMTRWEAITIDASSGN